MCFGLSVSVYPPHHGVSLVPFLPEEPGVGHRASPAATQGIEVAAPGAEQSAAADVDGAWRLGVEEPSAGASFEEGELQEHGHLAPGADEGECLLDEGEGVAVGRVGDDVARPGVGVGRGGRGLGIYPFSFCGLSASSSL